MDTDQIDDEIAALKAENEALAARVAALEVGSASTAEAEQVAAFNAGDDYQIALSIKVRSKTYAEQPALFQDLTAHLAAL